MRTRAKQGRKSFREKEEEERAHETGREKGKREREKCDTLRGERWRERRGRVDRRKRRIQ